tara:strand:- start:283 stop:534 length:252 start_codon:yes stop_codon:yes gene_type:complete
MRGIQIFALMQNQVMEIKNGMSLTRNVKNFRVSYKRAVGLPRNASNLVVLQDIGRVYKDNNMSDKFNDYMVKFNMIEEGIELV